jgi:hypothetical protein
MVVRVVVSMGMAVSGAVGESPLLSPPSVLESGLFDPDPVDLAGHWGVGVPACRSVLGRGPVAQRGVTVSVVVFVLEVADDHTGLEQSVPVVAVETLLAQSVIERFDVAVDPRAAGRNVDQAGLVLAEPLQRLGTNSGTLSIRSTFGGPPATAKTVWSSVTRRSAGIERSTMFSREHRVCSSIIEAILTALPSVVESNWKSIAHTTFGASASIGGTEDTPARLRGLCTRTCKPSSRHPPVNLRLVDSPLKVGVPRRCISWPSSPLGGDLPPRTASVSPLSSEGLALPQLLRTTRITYCG